MRSLLLLKRLQLGGLFRRWKRSLSRPKGLLTTIVMALVIVPWLGFTVATPFLATPQLSPLPGWIDRFGPAGLLVILVLSVVASTGEAALYFSPAEIGFLFPGPYTRRQLIGYKLAMALLSSCFSAIWFAMLSASTGRFGSAFVGSILLLMLFQLTQMNVGLAMSMLGTIVWNRAVRVLLLGLAVVIGLAVLPGWESLRATDWQALGLAVERSPVTQTVLSPFAWFVRTYTARDLATLVSAGVPAALICLGLLGLVFVLDASYLEASATASARRLERFQKALRGGGAVQGSRAVWFRVRPPDPAWWGGLGPNLWRQMIGAFGDPGRMVVLTLIFAGGPYLLGTLTPRDSRVQEVLLAAAPTIIIPATLLLSLLLAYDFRGDLNVMTTLKMLPIQPNRLALGQVLTPTLLASFLQASAALGLLIGVGGLPGQEGVIALGIALLLPANLYFFVIENLCFLWFPTRMVAGQFDGMMVIRQMLLLLAKGIAVALAAGIAAGVGAAAFFALGRRLEWALVGAWSTLLVLALGLLPILGQAFTRFDVNHDVPAP